MKNFIQQSARFALTIFFVLGAMVASAQDFTQEQLEKMVAELSAHIPQYPEYSYPINCSIEESSKINAYATVRRIEGIEKPQATMVVFTGLVEFLEGDQDLIRAVVAHELAHLSKGHPTSGGYKVGELQTVFIRHLELEADSVGAACLAAAGFDKDDMIRMLLKLDELGEGVPLMHQIGSDHPTGAARAAVVADNPLVYRSLAEFQLGNAFMENRRYALAEAAYARAIEKEPEFPEAYINRGQALLMNYYDNLPRAVQNAWFRPDFGPVISSTPLGARKIVIDDDDRERFAKAVEAINLALEKAPGRSKIQELKALSLVLDPAGEGDNLAAGVEMFEGLLSGAMTEADTLRYSNNMAIGLQRRSDVQGGVEVMMTAQEKTSKFNRYLAQNLGLRGLEYVEDANLGLALGVVYAWLQNTPSSHSDYGKLRETYLTTCRERNFEARDVSPLPTYLCQATTIRFGAGEVAFMQPITDLVDMFGKATKAWRFNDNFPSMLEYRWDAQQLHVVGDGDRIFRLTSYEDGATIVLRPRNDTVERNFEISVGMTMDEFGQVLNPAGGVPIQLVRAGSLEEWLYFPALLMGVCVQDDKVVGVTVTPAYVPDEEE